MPYRKYFHQSSRVSLGRPHAVIITIYADGESEQVPLLRNHNVKVLCLVEADLSESRMITSPSAVAMTGMTTTTLTARLKPHVSYILWKILAFTNQFLLDGSDRTTYTSIYRGVRYQTVTAEYI